jgi:hypothetical protein
MLSNAIADVYDPGLQAISPERLAATLKAPLSEIARLAGVHRNTLARSPGSSKVQARLGDVLRILTEAADLLDGDLGRAVIWFRHQPLAGFAGETAEELVTAGQAKAVLDHLRMLQQGTYA